MPAKLKVYLLTISISLVVLGGVAILVVFNPLRAEREERANFPLSDTTSPPALTDRTLSETSGGAEEQPVVAGSLIDRLALPFAPGQARNDQKEMMRVMKEKIGSDSQSQTANQIQGNVQTNNSPDTQINTQSNTQSSPPVPAPASASPAPAQPPPSNPPNASAGSAGRTDLSSLRPGSLGFRAYPPARAPFIDPIFGTTLTRFTNATVGSDYATHDYSQLQAFSADSRFILINEEVGKTARRVADGSLSALAPLTNKNNVRWWPERAHTLFFYDSNEDDDIVAQMANVDTGAIQDVFTFPARYDRIRVNQSFDELSDDGRWAAGMAAAGTDDLIFALDLANNRLTVELSLAELYRGPCQEDPRYGAIEPDWIAPSPLGRYLIVNWPADGTGRCQGQETYNLQTGAFIGHSYDSRQHGDLAVTPDGREVFITTAFSLPGTDGLPGLVEYSLPTGANSPRLIRALPWHGVWHISCRGPRGLCVITSFADDTGGELAGVLESEIYIVYLDGSVRRLTHHRSSGCGYWVQPRATVSLDGRYVAFDSDFQVESGGQDSCRALGDPLGGGEVFLILLPAEAKESPRLNQSLFANAPAVAGQNQTTAPANEGETSASNTVNPDLGRSGSLPATTYTLRADEEVRWDLAESPWHLILSHTLGVRTGEDACFDEDFINYEFYLAPSGLNNFTLVGSHAGAERGSFINGHGMESQGCSKGVFLYTLAAGSYRAAVCIVNGAGAERYCTQPLEVVVP